MLVLIESPYRNGDRARNLRYLAWCEFHSDSLGEHPIASHANCTAYIAEDKAGRARGFAWREEMAQNAGNVAYYCDLGISPGAQEAMDRDNSAGRHTEQRNLPAHLWHAFRLGEWPPGSMMRVPVGDYRSLEQRALELKGQAMIEGLKK
jgi:hypothetical protein